ncbi:MAG: hypothetical protein AB8I58_06265 [Anaerolineales bacterium]
MQFISRMLQKTSSGYTITQGMAETIYSINYVLGLKEENVSRILVAGIPMMTAVAADDPQIAERLFSESKKKDRSKTKKLQYAVKDYFTLFGDRGLPLTKTVAAQTGDQVGDVNNVMGLFLPIFVDAIEEEHPRDEEELAQLFREDMEEVKSDSPVFADTVMKIRYLVT